ncbi:MAG: NfeD family protein [Actinomycetota bacterium]|nr:NfeD family protein [Actinomycetota bacterium]
MEWLGDNAWLAWLLVALALGAVEITTLDLMFLMLAAGALAGAGAAALSAPVLVQVVVAAVVAVAMIGLVRPVALRHLHQAPELRTGAAALVGRQGLVLEPVDAQAGRIRLAGEVWSARSFDPGLVIEPGRTVDVVQIDGATAIVYESEL